MLNRRASGTVPFSPDPRQQLNEPSVGDDMLKSREPQDIRLAEERGVDNWMGQKYLAFSHQSPVELVPPFIRLLRRNEELLAKKVSQLSIMLREAKGELAALPAIPISSMLLSTLHLLITLYLYATLHLPCLASPRRSQ
jgi:hypothetical protein